MAANFEALFTIAGQISSSFSSSLTNAVESLQGVASSAMNASNRLKGLDSAASKTISVGGKLVAGAAAITAGFLTAADAIAQTDIQLKSLSDSVGMSVADVEALGASVAPMGMDYESVIDLREEFLNKFGESKSIYAKEVKAGNAEAIDEIVGGMKDSYEMLGLDAAKSFQMTDEQAWKQFIDATLKHKNNAEAQAAADIMLGGDANKITGLWRSQDFESLDAITSKFNALNIRSDESRDSMMDFAAASNSLKFFVGSLAKEFFGLASGGLAPLITKFTDWASANKEVIASGVQDFANSVGDAFRYIAENWEQIKDISRFAFNFIATFVALTAAIKVFRGAVLLMNLALAINPFVAIGLAVMVLIAGINALVMHFGGWGAMWEKAKAVAASFGDKITEIWGKVKAAFSAGVNFVKSIIVSVDSIFADNPILNFLFPIIGIPRIIIANWSVISGFFSNLWTSVTAVVSVAVSAIVARISAGFNVAMSFISSIMATIKGIVSAAWGALVNVFMTKTPLPAITGVFNSIFSFLAGLPAKMMAIGANIIGGLIDGIKSKFDGLKSIWSTVNNWIPDFAKKKMEIHSPSRVMAGIGGHIMGGLTGGISDNTPQLNTAYGNALKTFTQPVNSLMPTNSIAPNTASASGAGVTLNVTQYITVGSGDAAEQAKQGAASGAQDMLAAYKEMKAREARLSL